MGKYRKLPFGYRMEFGRIVVHPNEKPWVEYIFQQYALGASFLDLAEYMAEEGIQYKAGKLWKENTVQLIAEAMEQELVTVPDSNMTLGAVKRRMQELEEEFANLLRSASCGSGQDYRDRFQAITEETARLKAQQEEISAQLRTNQSIRSKMQRITAAASQMEHQMTEWDEAMIRQTVHTVEVISADRIRVILTDGSIIMQEVHSESGTL